MTLYKVTGENGESCHGGSGRWTEGKWRTIPAKRTIVPCQTGFHLVEAKDLVRWLGPVIWEAEFEGESIDHGDKLVVRKARVIRKLHNWNERTARLFAADCAEHVLPLFEKRYPNDARPRQAIDVARRSANGEATREEMAAAWDAAWDAAGDAAGAAARAAAGDAAWAAARAAAGAAARAAAGDAARAVAGVAAGDAAGAAARAAAGTAELKWQTARLMDYLEGHAAEPQP